jgi:hypothetical protein
VVDPPDDEGAEARRDGFVQDGADLAGGLAAVAISAVGTPAFGVVGGVAVARLVRLGVEVWDRMIEPRQRRRASGAWLAAVGRAKEKEEHGDVPRDDGFLEPDELGESPASELMEGAMIHAANAYQQRKVPYIGFLWSSILYRPDVSWEYGHYLLGLTDRLTYRQLVALAFFAEHERGDRLTRLGADRQVEATPFREGLGVELEALGELSLLGYWQREGEVAKPGRTYGGGGVLTDFESAGMLLVAALMPAGRDLVELMELHRIPADEKEHIFELMQPSQ